MKTPLELELEAAEANIAAIRQKIKQGPCREYGHDWHLLGGANAGCGDDCSCSVPVYECRKCGDCDYGQNAEAETVRVRCSSDEENTP